MKLCMVKYKKRSNKTTHEKNILHRLGVKEAQAL